MANDNAAKDPLEFVRGMWSSMGFSLPGMITPTLDVDELDKRITDLKAVENWLKMNLSMLQMTTQGLEVQRAAIAAVQAMSQQARESGSKAQAEAQANPFASAAMWPWAAMTGTQAPGAQAGGANPAAAGAGPAAGPRKSAAEKK
ncbi:hypothetical protein AzCIB_4061 [Azoarcus sp. CIB]|uniref:PhaM family polyhydroxyalkanoate granule multifunctional regulatory protein n=1 Tax=Aromatoleum sp. (strain CIB) TaxID=198107 RepID=UPI00067E55D4|nr:PhaM family polyhydroxyalkanoate granule multifunctional regulatory protein [Azoarcus sp. CIB]AKU13954.1 hypothetical protein AzCIB_4061 [Azoarcus sp. CIB]